MRSCFSEEGENMVDPWEEDVETTSLTLAALVSGRLLLQVSETRILFWPWSEKNIALDLRWGVFRKPELEAVRQGGKC